jgi:hypothetical protein
VQSVWANLHGGHDVTRSVLATLQQQALPAAPVVNSPASQPTR